MGNFVNKSMQKKKRQFEDRETIKYYIKQNWNEISFETLRKLIASMQNKCVEILQLKGINVNIEFCTILLLNTNFQNCLSLISTPENVFFLTFFGGKVIIKLNTYIIFTQPLRSGRIWHKVDF